MLAVAKGIVDAEGLDALTLARLASELSVKPPSLYNHFAGIDGLLDALTLSVLSELFERTRTALVGRAGRDALFALAEVQRAYAQEHPGLYGLALLSLHGKSEEMKKLGDAFLALFSVPFRDGLYPEDELYHILRSFRAGIAGFIEIERRGGFALAVDREASYRYLLDLLWNGLESRKKGD
jgi:AcrR family transcriptional regulator